MASTSGLVSLTAIRTNNIGVDDATPETIAQGIAKIAEVSRKKLPEAKLLPVGVLPRRARRSGTLRRHGADFLEPDGSISREVMRDFLLPTARGYRILAEAIGPAIFLGFFGVFLGFFGCALGLRLAAVRGR